MSRTHRLVAILLAAATLLAGTASARAGWITIKNDTKQVIVIQETGGPLNRPIRGKSVKLQPGETYREYQLGVGEKKIVISAAETPGTVLAQDKLAWPKEGAAFAVKADGKSMTVSPNDAQPGK